MLFMYFYIVHAQFTVKVILNKSLQCLPYLSARKLEHNVSVAFETLYLYIIKTISILLLLYATYEHTVVSCIFVYFSFNPFYVLPNNEWWTVYLFYFMDLAKQGITSAFYKYWGRSVKKNFPPSSSPIPIERNFQRCVKVHCTSIYSVIIS